MCARGTDDSGRFCLRIGGVALGTYHRVKPKVRRRTQLRGADAGSEARWAKAAERADGVRDMGIGIAVRNYFRCISLSPSCLR